MFATPCIGYGPPCGVKSATTTGRQLASRRTLGNPLPAGIGEGIGRQGEDRARRRAGGWVLWALSHHRWGVLVRGKHAGRQRRRPTTTRMPCPSPFRLARPVPPDLSCPVRRLLLTHSRDPVYPCVGESCLRRGPEGTTPPRRVCGCSPLVPRKGGMLGGAKNAASDIHRHCSFTVRPFHETERHRSNSTVRL